MFIKDINKVCKKMNRALGISIALPEPDEKALRASAVRGLAVGAALAAAGMVFSSKWCMAMGAVGIAGGAVQWWESGVSSDDMGDAGNQPSREKHPPRPKGE